MFSESMVVEAIHAGVECGLFVDGLDEIDKASGATETGVTDAVSFGPNILDIHTPKERLEIESVERTWRFILEVLKELMK